MDSDATKAAAGLIAGGMFALATVAFIGLSYFTFWLLTLAHCLKRRTDKDRLVWVLVIIFVPFFGALFYHTIGRQSLRHSPPPLPPPLRAPPLFARYAPQRSQPPLSVPEMADERKRAQAINEALATPRRPSGRA